MVVSLVVGSGLLRGQDARVPSCRVLRHAYSSLNEPMLARGRSPGGSVLGPVEVDTEKLKSLLVSTTLSLLTAEETPSSIEKYLSCMQEENDQKPWQDLTNTPVVVQTSKGGHTIAFAAMLMMRGGDGIPATSAFLACFSQDKQGWRELDYPEAHREFEFHGLFVQEILSPVAGEAWFLVSGRRIGDTGGRLRVKVVSCGAKTFRTVWARDGMVWGEVTVDHDRVILTYSRTGDSKTAGVNHERLGPGSMILNEAPNDFDPKRFRDVFRIDKSGLQPVP
jgi:hypothetical protein